MRALRERAGWSQVELSKRSGVPQNTLSALETGDAKRPNFNTLRRIADAFVVPLESLTGDAPIPGAPPAALVDADPLELALFRAMDPDKHKPSVFDAARRAAREAGQALPQSEPAQLAAELLDAAAALAADGHGLTTVNILGRALAARSAPRKAKG